MGISCFDFSLGQFGNIWIHTYCMDTCNDYTLCAVIQLLGIYCDKLEVGGYKVFIYYL